MKAPYFKNPFLERDNDPGFYVVQATSLLRLAIRHESTSFIIYAALELRMAIEQLVFTIIALVKDGASAELIVACRKKDGLFRILNEVAPHYTLRSRFQSAVASVVPECPNLAVWDIKQLIKLHKELSPLCHSQLVVLPFHAPTSQWPEQIERLRAIIVYLAEGLSRPTAFMHLKDGKVPIDDLWEKYSAKQIALDGVVSELTRRNPEPSKPVKSHKTIQIQVPPRRIAGG